MTDIQQTSPAVAAPAALPVAQNLIDGQWLAGGGELHDIISPASGERVTQVRYSTAEQVDAAVEAARRAQRTWIEVPIARRAQLLRRAADLIEERGEEISQWISREMGKTIREAREEAITFVSPPLVRAAAEDALRFHGTSRPSFDLGNPDRRVLTTHAPIGVGGFISPWNFPTEMIFNVAAAVVMGNTAVWKPSEAAPYCAQLTAKAFVDAGIPPGVLNVVYGAGDIGNHLVTNDTVRFIAFIGSTATGEAITRAAGVKRLLLELGGNGPLIVLDDADVDRAVDAAVSGCFYQAGQVCTASERILVQAGIHDAFVEQLIVRTSALKQGDPLDEATDVGPLSSAAVLDKTVRHVEDAVANGATVRIGGTHEDLYYAPTVLTGVDPTMQIAVEETFGPVAPVIRFSDLDEAVEITNASPYGLNVGIFTSSLKSAWLLADRVEAGRVKINESTNDDDIAGAFGGVKQSGFGRELGEEGLRAFTSVKTIAWTL